jgi:hypothetical protein
MSNDKREADTKPTLYMILFTKTGSNGVHREYVLKRNVNELAEHLNHLVTKRLPLQEQGIHFRIVAAWVTNDQFEFVDLVRLLHSEIRDQKFITTYDERLVRAYEQMEELKSHTEERVR